MSDAALAEVTGSALARQHRRGGVATVLGSRQGGPQRISGVSPVGRGCLQRLYGRSERVVDGLVAGFCLATGDYSVQAGVKCCGKLAQRDLRGVTERRADPEEKRAEQRPAGAAYGRDQG